MRRIADNNKNLREVPKIKKLDDGNFLLKVAKAKSSIQQEKNKSSIKFQNTIEEESESSDMD